MTRRDQALVLFVPVALPLLVLAASPGRLLPGFPHYRYDPLAGDAYGYYYCVFGIYSAAAHSAPVMLAALLLAAAVVVTGRRMHAKAARPLAYDAAAAIVAAAVAYVVHFTGAPQVGWPFVWSIPLAPLRALGELTPNSAFVVGLVLSIACNVVTVLASYALARRAGLSPAVATLGAAAVSAWPLLSLLTGPHAGSNGTWQDWLGVSLYTEPLSTALVTVALAIVVGAAVDDRLAVLAGALLGLATLVRGSNALIAGAAVLALALLRDRRQAVLVAVAGAVWIPSVLIYWPKGYPMLGPPTFPAHPFALRYAEKAWSESYLWHPAVLLVLVPIALLGITRASRRASIALWPAVGATALFYTFYEETPIHPRFMYVVLPVVLVYWVAGAAWVQSLRR